MNPATPAQRDIIVDLRERHGWSIKRIANYTGLTPGTVQYWVNRLGAWPEGRKPPRQSRTRPYLRNGRLVRPFTADEDAKILEMRRQGESLSAIGRCIGRPHNSVLMRLDQLNMWAEAVQASPGNSNDK